ncbi:MAG: quinone-dependent dihydroorotate dehydrogenase [Calditrichaeota bacterium]|nr:quinone-dependent dihydroorotate dehydrogenase [Calditrichota bacterium]
MMYQLIRSVLFLFDPETAHHLTMNLLRFPLIAFVNRLLFKRDFKTEAVELFGLRFKHRVGLAAGLDKDGIAFRQLADFGFAFVEIGTVTPLAQAGNEKPRLFRLKADEALINRMGFNNQGVDAMADRLKNRPNGLIIGANIGKNKITPNEKAADDYEICLKKLHDLVDYFVVNVSSPNTPDLRSLQEKEPLRKLLQQLQAINKSYEKPKPLLLKIAPDLTDGQLDDIIEIALAVDLAGIIATNTTIQRNNLRSARSLTEQSGGLSGKPLAERSTEVIRYIHSKTTGKIPIIGVGGIHSVKDAKDKLEAGASLVQLYTGFIYHGPKLIYDIAKNCK